MKKLVWIAAVTALGAMSFGQGGRMFFRGGGMGLGSAMQLATRNDVGKELNLTADQKSKLQDAQDEARQKMRDMFMSGGGPGGGGGGDRPDPAAMQKMFADMSAKEKETIGGILNADQLKRLHELQIQRAGINAITDKDVQNDLKLSDDQKKKITDLQDKQSEAMQAIGEKMRNQEIDRDQARTAFENNNKIMKDELTKILTADQAKQLTAMGGKPFTFDTSEDQQGFGRRGGGGGGGF